MAANDPFIPGANIGIRSVPNLRDIGGYATTGGGRVRAGVLYRSSALCKLADLLMLMLMLMGVSGDDVMADYLLTNRDLLPALQPLLDQFEKAGDHPRLLRPVLGVEPEYLETAITEMHSRFGSVEAYFHDGLGQHPQAPDRPSPARLAPRSAPHFDLAAGSGAIESQTTAGLLGFFRRKPHSPRLVVGRVSSWAAYRSPSRFWAALHTSAASALAPLTMRMPSTRSMLWMVAGEHRRPAGHLPTRR